jgi:hypothetical protein
MMEFRPYHRECTFDISDNGPDLSSCIKSEVLIVLYLNRCHISNVIFIVTVISVANSIQIFNHLGYYWWLVSIEIDLAGQIFPLELLADVYP